MYITLLTAYARQQNLEQTLEIHRQIKEYFSDNLGYISSATILRTPTLISVIYPKLFVYEQTIQRNILAFHGQKHSMDKFMNSLHTTNVMLKPMKSMMN